MTCKNCGKCCQNIFLPFLADEDEKKWIEFHGIEVIENEIGTFIKINNPCINLKDNQCSIHKYRPDVRRKYFCEDNKDFINKIWKKN
jgi:Fe-S-cluster containining protein